MRVLALAVLFSLACGSEDGFQPHSVKPTWFDDIGVDELTYMMGSPCEIADNPVLCRRDTVPSVYRYCVREQNGPLVTMPYSTVECRSDCPLWIEVPIGVDQKTTKSYINSDRSHVITDLSYCWAGTAVLADDLVGMDAYTIKAKLGNPCFLSVDSGYNYWTYAVISHGDYLELKACQGVNAMSYLMTVVIDSRTKLCTSVH